MTTEASAVGDADTEGKQKAGSATEPETENNSPEAATSEPAGEPSNKKVEEQASEPGSADVAASPEEEQLKPRTRISAGKGLSRLFSSFLKRRSQCSDDDGPEADKVKEEKESSGEKADKADDKEEEAKGEQKEAKVEEEKAEVKDTEEKEQREDNKKEGEKTEKKGSKKKKKEAKKKAEKKDEEKVKEAEVKKEEENMDKEEGKTDNEEKGEEVETKEEGKETFEEKEKGTEEGQKETKEEENIDKKVAKRKEKEDKMKKKEEEKAKRKAEEEERIKKKEEEKAKKKEEEKAREAEKAKKKEEEKAKKREEEEKAKEEKTKKKEEEKTKKKEDEKLKDTKKKDEGKAKDVKKKEKEKEAEKTEEKEKEEEKEKKKDKGKNKEKKEKEMEGLSEAQMKAPIAAPEPELKTEPDIEQAPDQLSVSSAEMQPPQEEQKDAGISEEPKEEAEIQQDGENKGEKPAEKEKEDKGKEKVQEEGQKENPVKDKKAEKKSEEAKGSKRQKTIQCKVVMLDDSQFECELDKHAKGQELLTKVCDHINLLEKDYFGLANWETPNSKTWLETTKEIRKQVPGSVYEFTFSVKFYPPDPAQLSEDLTRYYLCLQLRKDIMRGVLPCSFVTLSLLGSYVAQSELGEYDPEVHGTDYVKDLSLAPGQSKELEEKVMELHRTYRSMSPAQADLLFLENAKKLAMYGVDLHQAKDLDGVDITLGVCSSGLMVYKDKLRINRFPWPKVLKISYKRSSFFIKIRASEQEQYESTIGFKLPHYKASKKLWKVCVEHHTFFRVQTVDPPSSRRFPVLGSKFRYSGRTQAQTRQASSMIDRPAPRFTRSASKRLSRNLDGVVSTQRGTRPVSAPVFSQAALAEAGIPFDQPQTSTPIKTTRKEERKLEVTVEAVEPSKIESVADIKDFDKPNEDLVKHHASISELKRNFMEAVPESRPSEWDKRLSTHSPFRSLGINGQPLPGADGSLCISLFCNGSETAHEETSSSLGVSFVQSSTVSHQNQPGGVKVHHARAPVAEESREEVVVSRTSLVPVVEVERAQLPPSPHPGCRALDEAQMNGGPCPEVSEGSGRIIGPSSAAYFRSDGPQVIRCFQPPLVQTQRVTITAESNSLPSGTTTTTTTTTDVPVVPTQTIIYESSKEPDEGTEKDSMTVSSSTSITSETTSGTTVTTTTTHISKVVKSGSTETRMEKRIVITADSDADQDKGKDGGSSAL